VPRQGKKSRRSVEQRLEFIDYRLYWAGRVNRSDLIEIFGVSVPQASADLTQYQAEAKGNAVYDKTLKAYIPGVGFKPRFFEPTAARYLAEVRLIEAGIVGEDKAWAVHLPTFAVTPILRRRIEAKTLRRILKAIRDVSSIHVTYQSTSGPEPKLRWISPHALAFDGYRWHARAWCHTRHRFLDFVLARVLEIGEVKPSEVDPLKDAGWHREVTLHLIPHPGLTAGMRRAIELDFGMLDGKLEVKTRLCLSYYIERQFDLDREPSTLEPERHQIVLANRDELAAIRKRVEDEEEKDGHINSFEPQS
jgi:WYL domain